MRGLGEVALCLGCADGVEEVVDWDLDGYETELMDETAEKLTEQYERIA